MDGTPSDLTAEKLAQLKALMPEVFSENKIDFDRFKHILGEHIAPQDEHYAHTWIGKNAARQEALTETTATLIPDKINSIDFNEAQNIFIEGENLTVLKLLQKDYVGKIKMIYIDPPYNTGNDNFAYTDNFKENKTAYKKRQTLKNTEGGMLNKNLATTEMYENGHNHSAWLSMMYPRLYLARPLLTEDGVIFMSIDDNEAANLKILSDEIFGEENFIGQFIWVNRTTPNDAGIGFATDHEYILAYAKNKTKVHFKGEKKDLSNYKNPDNDPKGAWIADNPSAASGSDSYKFVIQNPYTGQKYLPPKGRFWAFAPRRVAEWTESGKLVFPKELSKNFLLKKYVYELKRDINPLSSIIKGILTSAGTKELKNLFDDACPFKYPKPTALIKLLIAQITHDKDIVLDFFAGSGTTAQAVLDLNIEYNTERQFICVQIPEKYTSRDTQLNTQYAFVSDVTKIRIHKVIERYKAQGYKDNKTLNVKAYVLLTLLN